MKVEHAYLEEKGATTLSRCNIVICSRKRSCRLLKRNVKKRKGSGQRESEEEASQVACHVRSDTIIVDVYICSFTSAVEVT